MATVDRSPTGPGAGESTPGRTTAAGSPADGETAPGVIGRVPERPDEPGRRGGGSDEVFPPFTYRSEGGAEQGERDRSPGGEFAEGGRPARTPGGTDAGQTTVSTDSPARDGPGAVPEPDVATVQRRSDSRSRSGGHGAVERDRGPTFTHLSPGPERADGSPAGRDPAGRSADTGRPVPAPVTGPPGRLTDPVPAVGAAPGPGPAGAQRPRSVPRETGEAETAPSFTHLSPRPVTRQVATDEVATSNGAAGERATRADHTRATATDRSSTGSPQPERGDTPTRVVDGAVGRVPVTVKPDRPASPVGTPAATPVGESPRSAPTDAVPPQSASGGSPSEARGAVGHDTGLTVTHLPLGPVDTRQVATNKGATRADRPRPTAETGRSSTGSPRPGNDDTPAQVADSTVEGLPVATDPGEPAAPAGSPAARSVEDGARSTPTDGVPPQSVGGGSPSEARGAVGHDTGLTFTHLSPGVQVEQSRGVATVDEERAGTVLSGRRGGDTVTHLAPGARADSGRARTDTGRDGQDVTVSRTDTASVPGAARAAGATDSGDTASTTPLDRPTAGTRSDGPEERDTGPTFTHLAPGVRAPAEDSTDHAGRAASGGDTAKYTEGGPAMTVTDTDRAGTAVPGDAGADSRDGADRRPAQSPAFTHLFPAPPAGSGRERSTGGRPSDGTATTGPEPGRSSAGDRSVRQATYRQDPAAGSSGGGSAVPVSTADEVALVTRSTARGPSRAGSDQSSAVASAGSVSARPAEMTLLSAGGEAGTDGTASGEDLNRPGTQNSPTPADSMPSLTLQSTGAGGDRPSRTQQASAGTESAERERDRSRSRETAGDETSKEQGPRDHTRRVGQSLEPGAERRDRAEREQGDRQREERVESDLTMNSLAPQVDATARRGEPRDITYRERESVRPGQERESVDAESLFRAVEGQGRPPAGLDRVVERLYRKMERRRRIERERRGL